MLNLVVFAVEVVQCVYAGPLPFEEKGIVVGDIQR
jgi:hypothetical protein